MSPPPYGARLLPMVVDETAKNQPDLPYAYEPRSNTISDGFRTITFSDIATAANYMAGWIRKTLGPSPSFETLAYIGPGDLRYVVVFLAAVKSGYKLLLPSPKNSAWMNASLLEQTQCRYMLHSPEVEPVVRPLQQHKLDLELPEIGTLNDMVKSAAEDVPWHRNYEATKWDPVLVLHSSGSTGAPKPIIMNHATFAVGDNDRNLTPVPGRVNQNWSLWDFPQQETFFSPFPPFHLAGFSSMVLLPIYYQNAKLVLNPPTRPPTGHLFSEIMDRFPLKSVFCPPIIAEQLVQEPGGLDKCKNLKFLLYAGGPLSQDAGRALSQVTDVCQFYGQTETGAIQALVPRREDWAYLEWHPVQEVVMEPYMDGLYEMAMRRNPKLEKIRSISANFPDVQVWRTKDLFKQHPTKPELWAFHGRVDDIIVLSNGEKFNPVPSEVQISAHPIIAGALIVGQGHPQPALIIELKDPSQTLESIIDSIWPTVESANEQAPAHGRITKDMILASSASTSFVRSPKGTVVRTTTIRQYQEELAELYARDVSRNLEDITLGAEVNTDTVLDFVSKVVASVFPGHNKLPEDDLFVQGLDSLQTIEIVKLLKAGLMSIKPDHDVSWISMKLIYRRPTIAGLAHTITNAYINGAPSNQKVASRDRVQSMQAMVERYSKNLPEPSSEQEQSGLPPKLHVILTGSTGSLGMQLLLKLLAQPNIEHITCLDRSPNARERVTAALTAWSVPPNIDSLRVSFQQAQYGKEGLGLPPAVLSKLQKTANLIIHNAWKVDFNQSLDSFEEVHIRGVRNLIDFSAASSHRPRIVFISSISSIGEWPSLSPELATIPESLPPGLEAAGSTGYAESKAVAEHILAAARTHSSIDISILRVGQIAGPAFEGATWNLNEWFPLMLRTCKSINKIPNSSAMGAIDWIPVDILASVVCELSQAPSTSSDGSSGIYHLVNPSRRPWADLLPTLKGALDNDNQIEEVSMNEWTAEVEKTSLQNRADIESRPALKILDFYRDISESGGLSAVQGVIYATDEAQKLSPTLRTSGPITEGLMLKWLKEWGF